MQLRSIAARTPEGAARLDPRPSPTSAWVDRERRRRPPGGVSPLQARSRHHRLELIEGAIQLLARGQAHLDTTEAGEAAQLPHDPQLDLRALARPLEHHARHRLAQEALERRLRELLTPDDPRWRVDRHARPVEAHGTPTRGGRNGRPGILGDVLDPLDRRPPAWEVVRIRHELPELLLPSSDRPRAHDGRHAT